MSVRGIFCFTSPVRCQISLASKVGLSSEAEICSKEDVGQGHGARKKPGQYQNLYGT